MAGCWATRGARRSMASARSHLVITLLACACRFSSLPRWVKVMLTGRPQVEEPFWAWDPVWIKPEDKKNHDDPRHSFLMGCRACSAACWTPCVRH